MMNRKMQRRKGIPSARNFDCAEPIGGLHMLAQLDLVSTSPQPG